MEIVDRKELFLSEVSPVPTHTTHWWMPDRYEPYLSYLEDEPPPIPVEFPEHQSVLYIQVPRKILSHDSVPLGYRSHQVLLP
jgi:hypothetical protein